MSDNDIAIKVENLSKYYRLGVINNGTLFRDIQSWWARVRGKEDPHAKIGSKYDPTAEGFWALKDLNFEIKKGDRVGIIGHNGAGKSTLLKLLSQITGPTEGSIKINGKIASLLEVGTGFHPEMTGRENIYMDGAILGMSHDEIDKKVNDIIEFSEIGEHIDTPVKRYSSGMYVRLAFAVAAHLDSDILIADEVLAVGDAAFQKKALGKMNELSSGQGRTVLFVSHNMAQVKNLCNKGMVLERGRIIQEGNLENCITTYLGINPDKPVGTTIWLNNGSFNNPLMTPKKIEVMDENGIIVTGPLNWDKNYSIRLIADVKDVNRTISIGYTVFNGIERVYSTNALIGSEVHEGENQIIYHIPSHILLPSNNYKIVFESSAHNEWVINPNSVDISIRTSVISEANVFNWELK